MWYGHETGHQVRFALKSWMGIFQTFVFVRPLGIRTHKQGPNWVQWQATERLAQKGRLCLEWVFQFCYLFNNTKKVNKKFASWEPDLLVCRQLDLDPHVEIPCLEPDRQQLVHFFV